MLSNFGWSQSQMDPLIKLWNGESGWNQFADNPSSDAYGIPQSLPGSKMASEGADWRTNPATQIRWGMKYIKNRPDYGSPSKAWAMWNTRSPHWYDTGGWLKPGATNVVNDTGKPEAILNEDQWGTLSALAGHGAVSMEEAKGIRAANGMHVTVHNNQHYVYDQRNDFGDAQITIQAQDPDEMARKLEARVVASRLTETRGVRRNPR
jgi:SLT domain-containing protein